MYHRVEILAFVVLSLTVLVPSTLYGGEDGFRSIFDGKTLDGWDGNPNFWSVSDGAITGKTTENPGCFVFV